MSELGRRKSRKIDDSLRPAAERGLPLGETRYSTVYSKDQLQKVKDLVAELIKAPGFKKQGSIPNIQFKTLIKEALADLLKKYERKLVKVCIKPKLLAKHGKTVANYLPPSKENEGKLRAFLAKNAGK